MQEQATVKIAMKSLDAILAYASARLFLHSDVRFCGIESCKGCPACFVNRISIAVNR